VNGCPNLISGALECERVWIPETGISAHTYAAIFCTDCFDVCCRLEGMWESFAGPSPLRLSSTQRWTPACIAGGWSIWRAGLVAARRGACTLCDPPR